jgi:protein pelota
MKAEFCDLQRSFGEIRLFPENVDDLWHLEHLIAPGDLVFATTLRTVDTPADKLRPEKLEKRPVRLGIRVGKLEFHPYVVRLRISGVIEQGADTGAYHTLNIEPGYEISVIRYWRPIDRERIDRAVKASVFDVVHILTIEEGEAELFRIRQYGPEGVVTITMGSGKGGDIDSRAAFFDRVSDHLDGITGPLVIAGPGFIKDDFLKVLRGRNGPLAARAIVMETRRIGAGAVQEVIGHAVLDRIAGDIQLAREVQLMDEFLARMAKGLPVAYGRAEVQLATDSGAVEQLLVSDTLIRDPIVVHLMDRAELTRAQVTVFSSSFDPGKQLGALGGIAALLRFPVR